jgi:hypothetical protein
MLLPGNLQGPCRAAIADRADSDEETADPCRQRARLVKLDCAPIFHICASTRTGVVIPISDPERTPFMTRPRTRRILEFRPTLCGTETTQYSRDRRRLENPVDERKESSHAWKTISGLVNRVQSRGIRLALA